MFMLKLRTSNDAFIGQAYIEIARILRDTAEVVERGGVREGQLRDGNGNTVGSWKLTGHGR